MAFIKINSYTRVYDDGTKSRQQRLNLIDKNSISKSEEFTNEAKKILHQSQTKNYKSFCSEIFEDRKYISLLEFNKRISQNFNNNSTYYRKRMVTLNLITVRNNVVYPVI